MPHLFRDSVKCIDVTGTTKKSFVQDEDEHDPHRRQKMKVRFTQEHDEIHVLKQTMNAARFTFQKFILV